jgi:hypothetical protein
MQGHSSTVGDGCISATGFQLLVTYIHPVQIISGFESVVFLDRAGI